MITNLPGLTAFLVSRLQAWAKESNTVNGCVGLSGGIDSAVVLALCCRAFPKTVAVLMPCHSSGDSISMAHKVLASQAALGYCIEGVTVPLETAYQSIVQCFDGPPQTLLAAGSLRSCLRAPVLDFVSKENDALVYGTGNRDEDEVFRYYQKRGDGAVDNNVIVGLHKSEVRQLADHLGIPGSVINQVPTADLWGPGAKQTDEGELGLTYDEIEWVTRMADTHQILSFREDHAHSGALVDSPDESRGAESFRAEYADKFSDRQFEIIEKAYAMEKSSRHKAFPTPGVRREEISYFVI